MSRRQTFRRSWRGRGSSSLPVSSSIRWPEREPPSKGGHLVLVTAASDQGFRFHNPSGHTSATQENAMLAPADFDRFFANRGIAVAI